MESVIAFACLLTVAYALPQVRDKECPCEDNAVCTMIGKYNLCICPSGDKHLWGASGDPYVNCTLPGLNPCSEDPCGDNAVCAIAHSAYNRIVLY